MARIHKLFAGKVGAVVLYERLGTPCMRSLADRVRQSKATKKAASLFGKAAGISRVLREGLTKILPDYKNRQVMYPLNRALQEWLTSSDLKGFVTELPAFDELQFNAETNIQERLNAPVTIDWNKPKNITLRFPDDDLYKTIKSPAHTIGIYLELAVTGCKIADGHSTGSYFTSIKLTANSPTPSVIDLPFQLQSSCLTIVVAALKYERIENRFTRIVKNKKWLPVGVIGACYGKSWFRQPQFS